MFLTTSKRVGRTNINSNNAITIMDTFGEELNEWIKDALSSKGSPTIKSKCK